MPFRNGIYHWGVACFVDLLEYFDRLMKLRKEIEILDKKAMVPVVLFF